MADYTTKFLVLFAFVHDGQGISCLSNNNQNIDWFIYYKPPSTVNRDRRFYYMDPENPVLTRYNTNMEQSNHALAYTLNSIKNREEDLMYLYYNDQTKTRLSSNVGHAKGVTAFDDKEGFWIIHSAPNFPEKGDKYVWQRSADRNGQTFLCATMRTQSSLNNIDIYDDLMAKNLRNHLYVQSWLSGSSKKLTSSCDHTYKVYNVEQIRLPSTPPFNTTQDHSKWAVSQRGRWVCFGDLNRVESQMKRGGGALCMDDSTVGKQFVRLVGSWESCPEGRVKQVLRKRHERFKKVGKAKKREREWTEYQ